MSKLDHIQHLDPETLTPHALAAAVPRMVTERQEEFDLDVAAVGVKSALLVQRPNLVLDGVHRLRSALLARQKSVPCVVVDYTPEEQEAAILRALLRRDMTKSRRAMFAAAVLLPRMKASEAERRSAAQHDRRAREHKTETSAGLSADGSEPRNAADIIGRRVGVSARYIFQAAKILAADKELAAQVAAGRLVIPKALKRIAMDEDGAELAAEAAAKTAEDRAAEETRALNVWAKRLREAVKSDPTWRKLAAGLKRGDFARLAAVLRKLLGD